jgi:iron complex transport system substrate-binding protein
MRLAKRYLLLTPFFVVIAAAVVARHGHETPPRGAAADKGPRIVSLAPSVTEILYALHAERSLVGVTDQCNYPPPARLIEHVGRFGAPNVEKLLALRPDVAIAAGFERAEMADVLRQSQIRVLDVRVDNFAELFEAIRQIGKVAQAGEQAQRLVARMQAGLQAIEARTAATGRPKVFVEIADHPLMTAGASSFIDDLIARAGGINVAHGITAAYPKINPEKVVEWNPDVILLTAMDRPGTAAQLSARIGWADITAVKRGHVVDDIHPDLLFRPGPRLLDGVRALAERLHGPKEH